MTNIYPAPIRWFRLYLKRQKCNCVTKGGFEIWSNGIKKVNIANNCIFQKPVCKMKLKSLGLSFEEFEQALGKHKAQFKKSAR